MPEDAYYMLGHDQQIVAIVPSRDPLSGEAVPAFRRPMQWGWPGVTPAAILTDPTAGAP